MSPSLVSAYELIRAFKAGRLEPGAPVSDEQQRLVRLLCADLALPVAGCSFEQLVLRAANADSSWSSKTQACIDEFYELREEGRLAEAEKLRADMLACCPSSWYRGILAAL